MPGEPGEPSDPAVPAPATVLSRVPTGTSRRRELAAAARSRGRESSVRDEIGRLRGEIAAIDPETIDLAATRRRAVEAEADEALGDLESAAAELSNAQTERIAAEQALERARGRAAAARDERERRLELEDRLRNRRREARRELAADVYPAFRDALGVVPGSDPSTAGSGPAAYDGPRLAASLAAVRIADLNAPVALGREAARWLTERGSRPPEAVLDAPVARPDATPDQ